MKSILIEMFQKITGYIYFIQMDRIGPIKIGFTKDVGKRLVSLMTGSPYPLRLLCLIPGNEDLEKQIHSNFREIRTQGEWFLPHPFLLKEIDGLIEMNKKNCFDKPRPEYDLGDWSFGSDKWDDPLVIKREIEIFEEIINRNPQEATDSKYYTLFSLYDDLKKIENGEVSRQ